MTKASQIETCRTILRLVEISLHVCSVFTKYNVDSKGNIKRDKGGDSARKIPKLVVATGHTFNNIFMAFTIVGFVGELQNFVHGDLFRFFFVSAERGDQFGLVNISNTASDGRRRRSGRRKRRRRGKKRREKEKKKMFIH